MFTIYIALMSAIIDMNVNACNLRENEVVEVIQHDKASQVFNGEHIPIYSAKLKKGELFNNIGTFPVEYSDVITSGTQVKLLHGAITRYRDEAGEWHDVEWGRPRSNKSD